MIFLFNACEYSVYFFNQRISKMVQFFCNTFYEQRSRIQSEGTVIYCHRSYIIHRLLHVKMFYMTLHFTHCNICMYLCVLLKSIYNSFEHRSANVSLEKKHLRKNSIEFFFLSFNKFPLI